MGQSVFPIPTVSTINANSLTIPTANTVYGSSLTLTPAIYSITCNSSIVASVEFMSSVTNIVAFATTTSGATSIELTTPIDRVRIWTNTGTNNVVTITKVASALTQNTSTGGITTLTTGSGTYTGTSASGYAYALIVGGGGGGAGNSGGTIGGGGRDGQVTYAIVPLTGSVSYSVGTGGAAGGGNTAGSPGTATTFGSATATFGAGGTVGSAFGNGGGNLTSRWTFIVTALGQGGTKDVYGNVNVSPTGYGAGGFGMPGSGQGSYPGIAGRPGVIYIVPIN